MKDQEPDGFAVFTKLMTSTMRGVADTVHMLVRQRAIRPRQGRFILRMLAERSGLPEMSRVMEVRARGFMFQNPRKGKRRI